MGNEEHLAEPDNFHLHAAVVPLPLEALPRDGRAPLDADALSAAWGEWEAVIGQLPPRDALALACVSYVRRIDARRLLHSYTTSAGLRIPDVRREEVLAALAALAYYGGEEGPQAEDAMARALAAARGARERHEAEERAHDRRHAAHARQIAADLAEARRRAAVRVTVSGSQR